MSADASPRPGDQQGRPPGSAQPQVNFGPNAVHAIPGRQSVTRGRAGNGFASVQQSRLTTAQEEAARRMSRGAPSRPLQAAGSSRMMTPRPGGAEKNPQHVGPGFQSLYAVGLRPMVEPLVREHHLAIASQQGQAGLVNQIGLQGGAQLLPHAAPPQRYDFQPAVRPLSPRSGAVQSGAGSVAAHLTTGDVRRRAEEEEGQVVSLQGEQKALEDRIKQLKREVAAAEKATQVQAVARDSEQVVRLSWEKKAKGVLEQVLECRTKESALEKQCDMLDREVRRVHSDITQKAQEFDAEVALIAELNKTVFERTKRLNAVQRERAVIVERRRAIQRSFQITKGKKEHMDKAELELNLALHETISGQRYVARTGRPDIRGAKRGLTNRFA